MKKIFCSFISIMLIIGVSGCMKQPTEKENKENELAMLSYLEEKYGEKFKSIEYIPAERGYNDSYNKNILIVESQDGILVNVREKLKDPGLYYDDYLNAFASEMIDKKIDYGDIENIQFGKTYVNLSYDTDIVDLKSPDFSFVNEIKGLYVIISISGKSDEKILGELYDLYKNVESLGFKKHVFKVAFGGDYDKSKKYVTNYFRYGIQTWNQYDESINELLHTVEKNLSFEEFKNKLIVIGD